MDDRERNILDMFIATAQFDTENSNDQKLCRWRFQTF